MRKGLYTSGFFHLFAGFLLITNFQLLENKPNEVLNNVSVRLLSQQELTALVNEETTTALEVQNFQPQNIKDPNNYPKKPFVPTKKNAGNEIKGITEPDIIEIKKRKTSDEIITDTAQRGDSEFKQQAKKLDSKVVQKKELIEKSDKNKSKQKNTSSQISSEGENVEIISGALKTAKLPQVKPNFEELIDKNNTTDNKSLKEKDEVYNKLIEQVINSREDEKNVETPIQSLAKARILQTLNDNWNVVSINRLPNYEKYVIILELKIDKNGDISGPIKLVYPEKVSGNFLIAKRSAIKAVLDSSPFPVSKESFPSGLVLRVVFDPKTNVGVNNG